MGDRALLPPDQRREFRRQRRKERLEYLRDKILLPAAQDMKLREHMFKTDEELDALHLTQAQRRKIRAWEDPKKQVAYGLETAANIFNNLMRAEAAKPQQQINVENMVIQLPEKAPEHVEAVVIEQDPEADE